MIDICIFLSIGLQELLKVFPRIPHFSFRENKYFSTTIFYSGKRLFFPLTTLSKRFNPGSANDPNANLTNPPTQPRLSGTSNNSKKICFCSLDMISIVLNIPIYLLMLSYKHFHSLYLFRCILINLFIY